MSTKADREPSSAWDRLATQRLELRELKCLRSFGAAQAPKAAAEPERLGLKGDLLGESQGGSQQADRGWGLCAAVASARARRETELLQARSKPVSLGLCGPSLIQAMERLPAQERVDSEHTTNTMLPRLFRPHMIGQPILPAPMVPT